MYSLCLGGVEEPRYYGLDNWPSQVIEGSLEHGHGLTTNEDTILPFTRLVMQFKYLDQVYH